MKSLRTSLKLDDILQEVRRLPYTLDGTGVKMAYSPTDSVPDLLWVKPVVEEIEKLRNQKAIHMMVNVLPSGIKVELHRDWMKPTRYQEYHPTVERWHLPLITNPDAIFFGVECGQVYMENGYWWGPVEYWKLHSIWNNGTEDRIHLVVDLDTPHPLGEY